MSVGCGNNFQDARILQVFVSGQHAPHQRQNAIKQGHFILFGKIPAFIDQGFEWFLRQVIRIDPCQIEPDLQIAKILLSEVLCRRGDCRLVRAAAQVKQFLVSRVNCDDVIPIGVKETLHDESLLFHSQFRRRYLRQDPIEVLRAVFGVILELTNKGRGQVDSRFHALLRSNHLSHVEVILGGVHPHPRSGVDTIFVFVIHRLMLMPGEIDVQRVFHRRFCRTWLFSNRCC